MTRLAKLDNAKGILICLVIFGHLIEPLIFDTPTAKAIYLSIYSVHMPAFALLAGMTTSGPFDKNYFLRVIGSILVPLIVFTVLFELIEFMAHGDISDYSKTAQPYWILWFLLSLLCWRVSIPLLIRVPGIIAIAVATSIIAGYIDSINNVFGASRTLYFFPFFLIGYKLTVQRLENTPVSPGQKAVAIAALLANLGLFYWLRAMPAQWVYGSMPYSVMHAAGLEPALERLLLYGISLISIVSILMLIPERQSFVTRWGAGSLVIYLVHGLLVKVLYYVGFMDFLHSLSSTISMPFCAVTTIAVVVVLSSRFVQWPIRKTLSAISRTLVRKPTEQ